MKFSFRRFLIARSSQLDQDSNRSWLQIFAAVILAAYLYAFLEWLFFITQPSYTAGSSNPLIVVSIFLFSGLIIAGIFSVGLLFFYALFLILPSPRYGAVLLHVGKFLLAFLLACLLLMLIDNFTYTLFNFGIVSSSGLIRAAYLFVFLGLIWLTYYWITPHVGPVSKKVYQKRRWRLITAIILLGLSLVSVLTTYLGSQSVKPVTTPSISEKPNILIIGADGLDVANLSAYGYERPTTPNLAAFAGEALVAENAFSNARSSAGSVISLLTGKLPTTTRVLHPPNLLQGQDALEHLPGIFKDLGYRGVEITMPFYIDAYSLNMQNGFDIVNNRSISNYPVLYTGWRIGGDYPFYFITITIERISSRLQHIMFLKNMENSYVEVTSGLGTMMTDRERTDQLISLLHDSSDPLFVHLQFIGTHGPYYHPEQQFFSTSPIQLKSDDIDFYDDTIRDIDRFLGEIFATLQATGKLENTIIAFYTDHSRSKSVDRVPWMIRFPNAQHAGTLSMNVQNLDFAPTILDYLDLPIPDWMEGDSVIQGSLPPDRRIYVSAVAVETIVPDPMWNYVDKNLIEPPFYQFGMESLVVCDQVFELDLKKNGMTSFSIPAHTAPCDPALLPSLDEAKIELINHLAQKGFDVSSLK